MTDLSHTPIPIEDWKGIYTRGEDDTTPQGYFLDCLNVKFNESDAYTRDGSVKILEASSIVRFFIYKRLGETTRHIFLDSNGSLFDSLYPGTPIWTDATFTDFSGLNFNNRYYITPHNRITGIPGKHVLVYDGSGTARLAGGAAPVGFTLGAANSASDGNVELGTHLFAVCFLTSSGFITQPGPVSFAVLAATGGLSVDLSALPIGPSGTVGRVILATKAIQDYNGDQNGYQFFIVSSIDGGIVEDNTSTTKTVSFFDSELIADATYLFTNRGLIPAGVCIANYNGRLCLGGINGDEHSVYISKPYDPEQMDTLTGFITVDPFESGSGITNLFNHRGNFIISKRSKLYQVTDNQSDPVTWSTPSSIDEGTGTECFGVGTILDSKSQQTDRAFVADRSGLILYEGYAKRPEATWIVKDTWARINKTVFNLIQVNIETETSAIYVSLPLDGATTITHILYGYYANAYGPYGFDPKMINWSLWTMVPGVVSIATDTDSVTGSSVLKYAGTAGNIYKVGHDHSVHNDDEVGYASFIQTGLYTVKPAWTQHLALVNMRITGLGLLVLYALGQDDSNPVLLGNKTLTPAPGKDLRVKTNYQSTKVSIKFSTGTSIDEYFMISRMDLYLKPMWFSAPDNG